ncbi:MAG: LapA family protein [Hyphomicrobiaceae bacterium]
MIARVLSWVGAFVAFVVLAALFLANRTTVRFSLDPFHPAEPALWVDAPMWLYLLALFAVGALIGGLVIWMGQGKWRRMARARTQEAMRWKGEADRLMRERDASAAQARGSTPATKPLALARR